LDCDSQFTILSPPSFDENVTLRIFGQFVTATHSKPGLTSRIIADMNDPQAQRTHGWSGRTALICENSANRRKQACMQKVSNTHRPKWGTVRMSRF